MVLTRFHELWEVGKLGFGWWGHAVVLVGLVRWKGLGARGRRRWWGVVFLLKVVHLGFFQVRGLVGLGISPRSCETCVCDSSVRIEVDVFEVEVSRIYGFGELPLAPKLNWRIHCLFLLTFFIRILHRDVTSPSM